MKKNNDKSSRCETHREPYAPTAPQKRSVVAVITLQFGAKDKEPTVTALTSVSRLRVGKVILQHDRKAPRGRVNAEEAWATMKPVLDNLGIGVELQEVDIFSTARRWYYGLVKAFEDAETTAALLFPGDLKKTLSDGQVNSLQAILDEAEVDALHPVDYSTGRESEQSRDAFKEGFDECVTLHTIDLMFPKYSAQIRALGLSKLRTEVILIGRDVFRVFEKTPNESWGPDPIPQLILTVLRNPALRVKSSIHLGTMGDDKGTRNPLGQFYQIARFTQQMLLDCVIQEDVASQGEEKQMAAYDRLRQKAEATYALTLRALNTNHQRLRAHDQSSSVDIRHTEPSLDRV